MTNPAIAGGIFLILFVILTDLVRITKFLHDRRRSDKIILNLMIEVEEKFELNDKVQAQIENKFQFASEREDHDIYFDAADNRLMLNDIWLRSRNGRLELKYPVRAGGHFNYREYEEPEEIYKKLNLKYSPDDDWKKILSDNGFAPIMDFKSFRRKYKSGKFNIDVDRTDFGLNLFEVEVMVENDSDVEPAEKEIFDFIKQHGIAARQIFWGKVATYAQKFNPALLEKLINAGVIRKSSG